MNSDTPDNQASEAPQAAGATGTVPAATMDGTEPTTEATTQPPAAEPSTQSEGGSLPASSDPTPAASDAAPGPSTGAAPVVEDAPQAPSTASQPAATADAPQAPPPPLSAGLTFANAQQPRDWHQLPAPFGLVETDVHEGVFFASVGLPAGYEFVQADHHEKISKALGVAFDETEFSSTEHEIEGMTVRFLHGRKRPEAASAEARDAERANR